jgi:hypothetical protein
MADSVGRPLFADTKVRVRKRDKRLNSHRATGSITEHTNPQNGCFKSKNAVRTWRWGGGGIGLRVMFTPEQAIKVQRGEQRYSSTLSLTSALDGSGWLTPRSGRFTPWKKPGTHGIGRWVAVRAGPDKCGIFNPTGIRFPDCLTRSESLYQLSYPGPNCVGVVWFLKRNKRCSERQI